MMVVEGSGWSRTEGGEAHEILSRSPSVASTAEGSPKRLGE